MHTLASVLEDCKVLTRSESRAVKSLLLSHAFSKLNAYVPHMVISFWQLFFLLVPLNCDLGAVSISFVTSIMNSSMDFGSSCESARMALVTGLLLVDSKHCPAYVSTKWHVRCLALFYYHRITACLKLEGTSGGCLVQKHLLKRDP